MAKQPYDDKRYLTWYQELKDLLTEFVNTEGNSKESLADEIDQIVEDIEEEA